MLLSGESALNPAFVGALHQQTCILTYQTVRSLLLNKIPVRLISGADSTTVRLLLKNTNKGEELSLSSTLNIKTRFRVARLGYPLFRDNCRGCDECGAPGTLKIKTACFTIDIQDFASEENIFYSFAFHR